MFEVGTTELDHWIGKQVMLRRELDSNPYDVDNKHIVEIDGEHFQRATDTSSFMFNYRTDNWEGEIIYLDEPEVFVVGSIQTIYNGSLALRVYLKGYPDSFGRPAEVKDVKEVTT